MTERQDKEKCGEHLLTPYTINNWSALNIEFFNALLTHFNALWDGKTVDNSECQQKYKKRFSHPKKILKNGEK